MSNPDYLDLLEIATLQDMLRKADVDFQEDDFGATLVNLVQTNMANVAPEVLNFKATTLKDILRTCGLRRGKYTRKAQFAQLIADNGGLNALRLPPGAAPAPPVAGSAPLPATAPAPANSALPADGDPATPQGDRSNDGEIPAVVPPEAGNSAGAPGPVDGTREARSRPPALGAPADPHGPDDQPLNNGPTAAPDAERAGPFYRLFSYFINSNVDAEDARPLLLELRNGIDSLTQGQRNDLDALGVRLAVTHNAQRNAEAVLTNREADEELQTFLGRDFTTAQLFLDDVWARPADEEYLRALDTLRFDGYYDRIDLLRGLTNSIRHLRLSEAAASHISAGLQALIEEADGLRAQAEAQERAYSQAIKEERSQRLALNTGREFGGDWVGGWPIDASGNFGTISIWVQLVKGRIVDRLVVKDSHFSHARHMWDDEYLWIPKQSDPTERIPSEVAAMYLLRDRLDADAVVRIRNYRVYTTALAYRIYMEYCDCGSLDAFLSMYSQDRGNLNWAIPEPFLWHMLDRLATAGRLLQQGGPEPNPVTNWTPIIHRDIKPLNIFLTSEPGPKYPGYVQAKLGDFGLAVFMPPGNNGRDIGTAGTFGYKAPEQIGPQEPGYFNAPMSEKTNVWAVGKVVFDLITASAPAEIDFGRVEMREPRFRYEADPGRLQNQDERVVYSEQLRNLIKQCTAYNPADRPTFAEILEEVKAYDSAEGRGQGLRATRSGHVRWKDPFVAVRTSPADQRARFAVDKPLTERPPVGMPQPTGLPGGRGEPGGQFGKELDSPQRPPDYLLQLLAFNAAARQSAQGPAAPSSSTELDSEDEVGGASPGGGDGREGRYGEADGEPEVSADDQRSGRNRRRRPSNDVDDGGRRSKRTRSDGPQRPAGERPARR